MVGCVNTELSGVCFSSLPYAQSEGWLSNEQQGYRNLSLSKIEPFIAPSSDGSILFDWAGKRFPVRQLEVYVLREAHHLFEYLKTEGQSEVEGEFALDEIYLILDWLFKV